MATDWDAIRPLYEAGETSKRALARQFGLSDTGLTKHALGHGWTRGEKPADHKSDKADGLDA